MRKVDNWQGPLHTAEATVNWIGYNLLCISVLQLFEWIVIRIMRNIKLMLSQIGMIQNVRWSLELGFVHSLIMSVYNDNCHPGICSCCLVSRESLVGGGGLPNLFVRFYADLTMLPPHLGAVNMVPKSAKFAEYLRPARFERSLPSGTHGTSERDYCLRIRFDRETRAMVESSVFQDWRCNSMKRQYSPHWLFKRDLPEHVGSRGMFTLGAMLSRRIVGATWAGDLEIPGK